MSYAPPASPCTTQTRAEPIGYLALTYVSQRRPCRYGKAPPATSSALPTTTARSRASPSSTSAHTKLQSGP